MILTHKCRDWLDLHYNPCFQQGTREEGTHIDHLNSQPSWQYNASISAAGSLGCGGSISVVLDEETGTVGCLTATVVEDLGADGSDGTTVEEDALPVTKVSVEDDAMTGPCWDVTCG